MICRNWKCILGFAAIQLGLVCLMAGSALADSFTTTYLAPGVQTPAGITSNYETFDTPTYSGGNLVTNFGGSPVTGTYTGTYILSGANMFGGAGGTGNYIYAPANTSYTLSLSSGVNYFGLWWSALDPANEVQFYNGNTLLYTFDASSFIQGVGPCPTSAPQPNFCGNPNAAFLGQDDTQQYAYLNFYDTTGSFDKIVFNQNGGGNFESDNQAIAVNQQAIVGTAITPEPATWIYLLTGLMLAAVCHWKKDALFQ